MKGENRGGHKEGRKGRKRHVVRFIDPHGISGDGDALRTSAAAELLGMAPNVLTHMIEDGREGGEASDWKTFWA